MVSQNTSGLQNKIVLLSLHGLGDTLMFLPAIRLVSQHFPLSEITVLVRNESVKDMLETAALPDNVFIEYFKTLINWRFKRTGFKPLGLLLRFNPLNLWVLCKIRELSPDISIAMTKMNSCLTPLMLKISGSRISVGESHGWGRYLLTKPVQTDLSAKRVLRNLSLLEALDIPQPDKPDIRLYPTQDSIMRVVSLIKSVISRPPKISFAVAPCATLGQRWRLWPCRYWAELIEMLTRKFDAACFILGGPSKEEEHIGEKISRNLNRNTKAYNFISQLSIKDTIALISLMDYICGIDCGLLHIAASVNTFIHAIWSITQIEHCPFTEKKQIVNVDCQCRKDYPKNIKPECRKKPQCLEHLLPEVVFERMKDVWLSRTTGAKIEQYW